MTSMLKGGWLPVAKDILVPVLVAAAPLAPIAYSALTEPAVHFVYDVDYEPNPAKVWSHRIAGIVEASASAGAYGAIPIHDAPAYPAPSTYGPAPAYQPPRAAGRAPVTVTATPRPFPPPVQYVVREPTPAEYAAQFERTMPMVLAANGLRAADSTEVDIFNVSQQELRNIRVHFVGCEGYLGHETWPDSQGSPSNANITKQNGQTTLRYDKLAPPRGRKENHADITFFGEQTDRCKPEVEAELPDGKVAVGVNSSIEDYRAEEGYQRQERGKWLEIAFKLLMSAVIIYLYFRVRKLAAASASAPPSPPAAGP